jgi:hypothetical protein
MRWVIGILAGLLLLFGLACLNYTKAGSWEHHQEEAALHDWPPPSPTIFYGGTLATVLGSAGIGFVAGKLGSARITDGTPGV